MKAQTCTTVAYKTRRLGAASIDNAATHGLQAMKLRARYAPGDISGAIVSAAYYARKTGHTMFVYQGNSYMHLVYRVSDKASDFLCSIGSTSTRVISVTSNREVRWHDVKDQP